MSDTTIRPFSAAAFNQYLAEQKLMGSQCQECGTLYLPPRAICPNCHSDRLEWTEFAGNGTLAAFTSVFIGPTFMNQAGFSRKNPYLSGVVTLEEGPSISARILELDALHPETIQIGTPMEATFVEQGEGEAKKTFLAFRPKRDVTS